MKMIYDGLILIEQDIKEMIESNLGRTGLLYRLHSRIKETQSIQEKILRKNYSHTGKLLQDLIGFRITTYFSEDIHVLSDYFSSLFDVIDIEYDTPGANDFNPVRMNLVCRMQGYQLQDFDTWKERYNDSFKYIDSTFEIQIRTTLSEGWHEIEHNMRYKCKEEWDGLQEESRMLNGIHATLETSDRAMFQLFEDIAYQHYKSRNWTGMLRNKFRLQFELPPLSPRLNDLFDADKELAKLFYKVERNTMINDLIRTNLQMNITFDNIIFFCNHLYIHNESIRQLTPYALLEKMEKAYGNCCNTKPFQAAV